MNAVEATKFVAIKPWQQMVASSCGAMITSLLVTPLDVVKIRLQAQQRPFARGQCFMYCNGLWDHLCECLNGELAKEAWYKKPGRFTGTMDAMVKIVRFEGVQSLWSGLPPTLVMAVPATMVYFTAYDQLKYMMGYHELNSTQNKAIPMIAGAVARVGAVTLISPLELVRTKMQSQALSYAEIGKAVKIAINQGGVLSLWRGFGPTILRDVPFSALYWFSYESLKSTFTSHGDANEPTFLQSFASGATAGAIAGVLTLPFDVVKTRRQIQLGESAFAKNNKLPTSTYTLLGAIYKHEGFNGLFAGIVPRIIKVAPACAIMISTYEYAKSFFRHHNMISEH